jgi:Protein of unknown function (DUF4079)
MNLSAKDTILLLHPVLAIIVVFPLLGIVIQRGWQVRQKRTNKTDEIKSSPSIGKEHVQIGRCLVVATIGITLLSLDRAIYSTLLAKSAGIGAGVLILLLNLSILAGLIALFRARRQQHRWIWAAFAGIGMMVLGAQDGVYRRDAEWYVSHFYYGMTASLIAITAVAMQSLIYAPQGQNWRKLHVGLNVVMVLLFIFQAISGTRDLLEIPPSS